MGPAMHFLPYLLCIFLVFLLDEKLNQHNIKDGFTVHLVIKSNGPASQPNNRAASTTNTTPDNNLTTTTPS